MMKQLVDGKSNLNKPVVLFIGANFKSFGGVERVTLELYKILREKFDVKVAVNKKEASKIASNDIENENIIHVDSYNLVGLSSLLKSITKDYKDRKIVIISTWYSVSVYLSLLCLKYKNIKFVASEHSDFSFSKLKWIIAKLVSYRLSDKLVVLTNKDKKIYNRWRINCDVIRNPVLFDKSLLVGEYDKINKIVYVGHFRKLKNVPLIIESINKAKESLVKYNWKVDLYGEGEDEQIIKDLIDRNHLNDLVEIHGYESKLDNIYKDAKFLVLASSTECLPMVIIESRIYNVVPIVSEYSSAVHELISNNQDGIIYPVLDGDKLATILEQVAINDFNFNFDKNNLEEYMPEYIYKKWERIINE